MWESNTNIQSSYLEYLYSYNITLFNFFFFFYIKECLHIVYWLIIIKAKIIKSFQEKLCLLKIHLLDLSGPITREMIPFEWVKLMILQRQLWQYPDMTFKKFRERARQTQIKNCLAKRHFFLLLCFHMQFDQLI